MTRAEQQGLDALNNFAKMTVPTPHFIPQTKATKKLYAAEEKRTEAIKTAAEERAALSPGCNFWDDAVPQALYDALDSFGAPYGLLAAEAYLQVHGWKIERPSPVVTQATDVVLPEGRHENRNFGGGGGTTDYRTS
jgi:hypothetical protein